MLDTQDEQFDRRLATHLVSLYHQSMADEEGAYLDMAVLRDYIAFARTYVHPDLSEEAGQALIQAYVGECCWAEFVIISKLLASPIPTSKENQYCIFALLSACAYIPTERKPVLNSEVHLIVRCA